MSNESPQPETMAESAIEKIVSSAESEFSQRGFDGAGMKAISTRAEVSQALLHYHFGNKDKLYEAVISRRSQQINTERLDLLQAVNIGAEDSLDQILEALFRPPLGPSGGQNTYARIFTGLVVGQEREHALVQKYYDPTAQRFVKAIEAALPGANQETAGMCYTLSLGALIAVIGRDGRVERLMGRDSIQTHEQILTQLVCYAKGGCLALAGAN